jgi:hypothetical protein
MVIFSENLKIKIPPYIVKLYIYRGKKGWLFLGENEKT